MCGCCGDGVGVGLCGVGLCRQDHLGAGELEFHGPVFWEYGQVADDIEYFSGLYQVVEVVGGIGEGYKGEKTFAIAFGVVGAFSEVFVQGVQCPPGGIV